MPRATSARRYAQAAFQIALENDELDTWSDDLMYLANALENEEFSEFLNAPQVSITQKAEVIKNTLGDTVARLAINLLSLLASRNLAHTMPGVVEQYQRMLDAQQGIEQATVVSAVPLNDDQRQNISEMLKSIVDKDIRLTSRVEPEIVGGIIARVGDHVIDGSTKTKLNQLRRELAS